MIDVTDITPALVSSIAGGELVTVTGSGFDEDTYVLIGTRAAQVMSRTATELLISVPPNEAGTYNVTVASYVDPLNTITLDDAFAYTTLEPSLPENTEEVFLPWNDEGGVYLGQWTDSSLHRSSRTNTTLVWEGSDVITNKRFSPHAWMQLPKEAGGAKGQITIDAPAITLTSDGIADPVWDTTFSNSQTAGVTYQGTTKDPAQSATNPRSEPIWRHSWRIPFTFGSGYLEANSSHSRVFQGSPLTFTLDVTVASSYAVHGQLGIAWKQGSSVLSTTWGSQWLLPSSAVIDNWQSMSVTGTPPAGADNYTVVMRITYGATVNGDLTFMSRRPVAMWARERAISAQARISVDLINNRPWSSGSTTQAVYEGPLRDSLESDGSWTTPVFDIPDLSLTPTQSTWIVVRIENIVAGSEVDRYTRVVQKFFGPAGASVTTKLTYGFPDAPPVTPETVVDFAPAWDPTITTTPPLSTTAGDFTSSQATPFGGSWHTGSPLNPLNPNKPIAERSFSVNCHRALPTHGRPSSIAVTVDYMNLRAIVGGAVGNSLAIMSAYMTVTRYTAKPDDPSATVISIVQVPTTISGNQAERLSYIGPIFTPFAGEWVSITLTLTVASGVPDVAGVTFNTNVSQLALIVYSDETDPPGGEEPPTLLSGITATVHEEDASVRFTLSANGYRMYALWFEWLIPNGESGWVRGYEEQSFGSITGVTMAEDFEAPIGVDVKYTLVQWPTGDARPAGPRSGDQFVIVRIPWTSGSTWLKNPLQPAQFLTDARDAICVISHPDRSYPANAGIFRPIGRAVPTSIFDVRSSWSGELVIIVKTEEADRKMHDMLRDGGPLLYQTIPELDGVNDYIQPGEAQKEVYPDAPGWYRRWTLPVIRVTRPLGTLGASPNRPTYSQLKAVWACCSYRHLKARGGTYLDMMFYMLLPPDTCDDRESGAFTPLTWDGFTAWSDWPNNPNNGRVTFAPDGTLVVSAASYDALRRETVSATKTFNIIPFARVKVQAVVAPDELNRIRLEVREMDADGTILKSTYTDWSESLSDVEQPLEIEVRADCGARKIGVVVWSQLLMKSSSAIEAGLIEVEDGTVEAMPT